MIAAVRMRRNNGKLLEGYHSCHASLIDIRGVILDNSSRKCDRYLGTALSCIKAPATTCPCFVAQKFKLTGRKGIKKLSRQKEQAYLNCKVDLSCIMRV